MKEMTPKQRADLERRLAIVDKYNYDNWSRVLKENYDGFTTKISNTIDLTLDLMKDNFMTLFTNPGKFLKPKEPPKPPLEKPSKEE